MRLAVLSLSASTSLAGIVHAQTQAGREVPTFEVTSVHSSIKFEVKASVAVKGRFDKWSATLAFQSPDVSTGVLEINIQADSVDTGSGMKNAKLKGKDFFDVERFPMITFKSTKIAQISNEHFEVDGDLTLRGASNPEKLTLVVSHRESHLGDIQGKMVFDRKRYGITKNIPLVTIADRVEIDFHLKTKHTGGPQLALNAAK
jgi:polyisoprenoid-binding protein YceI